MRKAIEKAREGVAAGQTPFGACVVRDGKIVSCAHNTVWADTDITAHAEINAIRQTCAKLGKIDLSDCVIYSTTEPCPMCYSAIHWSRIKKIVYGASIEDAKAAGFHELPICDQTLKKLACDHIKITPNILADECKQLFNEWHAKHKSKPY
jgi:tRNA(Arg) A34 adenosine deaminase TadA